MNRIAPVFVTLTCLLAAHLSAAEPVRKSWGNKTKGFYLVDADDSLVIHLDGKPIATYVYRDKRVLRPYFAHVNTPSGIQVTRTFPPISGKDPTDHATMHPGIWLAFAKLDSVSFWHNNAGRVVHKGFINEPRAGAFATFSVLNEYHPPKGDVLCREKTTYRIERDPVGYRITLDAQLTPVTALTFGVKEEMGLGVRVATAIRVRGGNGTILSSGGGRNEKGTWGKLGQWWDYFGNIDNRQVGMMVMSSAANGEVWSHSRDYGLLVANPFPVDIAKNRDRDTVVPPGKALRLRFGVLIHEQDANSEFDRVSAYERYVKALKRE